MNPKENDNANTMKKKRMIPQKNICVWEKTATFLDRLSFFLLGLFWTSVSVYIAQYYIGPLLIVPISCSICSWLMMFSDYPSTPTMFVIEEPHALTPKQREALKEKIKELD